MIDLLLGNIVSLRNRVIYSYNCFTSSTTGNLEASEPGQNTQEEEAQKQQEDAARPPRTERMAAQHATASSSRHRSRSPNTLVNERLLDFITVPPPPTVPTTACEHFLLSLVPQLNRLNARNQTKAKIAFLQVLDDLETSQESRPTPYAVPTQPYERHRSVSSDNCEGSRHPPFAPRHIQPYGSMGGPSSEKDPIMNDCESHGPHISIICIFCLDQIHCFFFRRSGHIISLIYCFSNQYFLYRP